MVRPVAEATMPLLPPLLAIAQVGGGHASVTDIVISSILKAIFKAQLETTRTLIFSHASYLTVQATVSFLRHISSCLLKDSSESDSLAEQVLTSLFSRYIHSNDIGSVGGGWGGVGDGVEAQAIGRVTSESITQLQKLTKLI